MSKRRYAVGWVPTAVMLQLILGMVRAAPPTETGQAISGRATVRPATSAAKPQQAAHPPLKTVGAAEAFDFDRLKTTARQMAGRAYQAPSEKLPEALASLTWDQMQAIGFKDSRALWGDEHLEFRVRFFHLGLYNKVPVKMYELHGGQARRLAYDPRCSTLVPAASMRQSCRPIWVSPVSNWPFTPTGGATWRRFKGPATFGR